MKEIGHGIYQVTLGNPEKFTPLSFRAFPMKTESLDLMDEGGFCPIQEEEIKWKKTKRGITVTLPMETTEDIYGFGLQLKSFNHAGKRRYIKVNSDPAADTGESHAPAPFYVSTKGYGLYVDTYRYITFLMGTNADRGASGHMRTENEAHKEFSESALYALKRVKEKRKIIIEIPAAEGVNLYFFKGNPKEAVQRYNLFSGGGCMVPMWGLGGWYRSYGGSRQEDIIETAKQFRKEKIPVDVLGLEPGWHSHSYSCSFKWSNLFQSPDDMVQELDKNGYRLNLWEHAFVYPTAPFYDEILPFSGNYEVWNGAVPDLAGKEARNLYENYHYKNFIEKGISGFKLDECDNSDYNTSNWSFPDSTEFPSGFDGEQMHMAVGIFMQGIVCHMYRKADRRTYSQVRSSGALAAPFPFVLYSDLYDHKEFIRGMVNSGFSGMLWCPEVRNCIDGRDLLRRIQSTVFSSHTLVNGWRIPNPPWKQVDIQKNLQGEKMPEAAYYTEQCRRLFELRMSLLPYLYSAFVKYNRTGIPPVRAMVMDYPGDEKVRHIDDQYLFGESMLVCPLTYEDGYKRKVYLPEGRWFQLFQGERCDGGKEYEVVAAEHEIPVFIREGSIIPWAAPVLCVEKDTVFDISVHIFGDQDGSFSLYEDDFESYSMTEGESEIVIKKLKGKKTTISRQGHGPHRYNIQRIIENSKGLSTCSRKEG